MPHRNASTVCRAVLLFAGKCPLVAELNNERSNKKSHIGVHIMTAAQWYLLLRLRTSTSVSSATLEVNQYGHDDEVFIWGE